MKGQFVKWGCIGVVGVMLLSAVFAVLGLVGGWFNAGVNIVSPQHVAQEWQFAYDFEKSLDALGRQHCIAVQAAAAETDPQAKTQRTTQAIQIAELYQQREAQFDSELADAFRARLVAPPDVPHTAPTIAETEARVCGDATP